LQLENSRRRGDSDQPRSVFSSQGVPARRHSSWLSERVAMYHLGEKLQDISRKIPARLEACHIIG
jgi:hypothetical protein